MSPAWSDVPGPLVSSPGYRPGSIHSSEFLDALDTATIAVYPSIIRRASRTAHSFESQRLAIALLNEHGIATAVAAAQRIDLGVLVYQSQQAIFAGDLARIADTLVSKKPGAQYHLVLEFLLPFNDQEIFGVHCYVLDESRRNAFSFLINSHHRLFVDAALFARDSTEEARSDMIERATRVAISALAAQIQRARQDVLGPGDVDYPMNERPMFGLREKTEQQKDADRQYIQFMTKDGRSREEAAETVARLGWAFFYQGDKATAIRRFNQAWLLDPENQLALWGFAVTCVDRNQLQEAARYYEMAIESGPENPRLRLDYEITLERLQP